MGGRLAGPTEALRPVNKKPGTWPGSEHVAKMLAEDAKARRNARPLLPQMNLTPRVSHAMLQDVGLPRAAASAQRL